ncbi:helicase domain protein [Crinalium epipsammum PCC 9333]|uniref:Helicase domain protein n=1 Tax=Crinalium epipsammum PCC 9333 TaxID=1173022 RepID=K9VWD0_9CYAN|nr:SNF2-related protein [Crinalium epipsammum]AFZ12281.1 helicase domain protein [Crinalium epipsammum PCC 9333]
MAILHGSWLTKPQGGYLFIWGETWRRITSVEIAEDDLRSHPLAMTQEEFIAFLKSRNLTIGKFLETSGSSKAKTDGKHRWKSEAIAFPTPISEETQKYPEYSPKTSDLDLQQCQLKLWQVEGYCLEPLEAIKFLQALPLGSFKATDAYLGGDIRFWSHVCRWSLDLLARSKFLPGINRQLDGTVSACWQPLLDSAVDQARLETFAQQMPTLCRTYQQLEVNNQELTSERIDTAFLALEPKTLIFGCLSNIIDSQCRAAASSLPKSGMNALQNAELIVRQWLQSLASDSSILEADSATIARLETTLRSWTTPIQEHLINFIDQNLEQNQFRTCFILHPPTTGVNEWKLEYCLQAVDNPDFLVNAETIWNNPVEHLVYQDRTIENPQETFLKGLGLAVRLYPLIEPSLHQPQPDSYNLNPIEVYEFIKASAWRLQDSGLGVVIPPSLMPGKGLSGKMGLKIKAEVPNKKERLGLQSLLKFKLELAVGDRTISKAEFDRLMALKTPLVEVNGEWIALQPQDIRAAEAILATRPENLSLSVEDALRLSTGDTKTLEKLPVVSFEASGVLQELITNLTDNQAIAPLPAPANFQGQLRPYQERGVGWLSFLERWGLGACLADDMGLGKCILPHSFVFVNGLIQKAEEIWQANVQDEQFDGEGFWANPKHPLIVNAINEQTGKIILAQIQRLYRQNVQEKLRTIKLKDGSSITITQRHKLLTNKGWTNNLQVGDYVCVPAKIVWEGKPEDPDLVKFLAWQIAEGYEECNRASLKITQKDAATLEELRLILHRFSENYGININRPAVRIRANNRAADLSLNSREYQKFLESRGYKWGKLSAEKSFPPFIMQADLNSAGIFLRNYFDAESAVIHSMRSIEIATASPVLIQQLSVLLRRFGIWMRIQPKQKRATNGTGIFRTYYIGVIGGNSARRFLQEIGFGNPEKQRKLEIICQIASNTNVEGIPASDIVAKAIEITQLPVRHFGMHTTVYINGSQQFSRTSLEKVIAGFDRIISGEAEKEYRQQKLSKWTVKTLERYDQLDLELLTLTQKSLQRLLELEVFYCQIDEIEEIDYQGWVYDFEVSEHHNFVANNILCHNTIQTLAFLLHLKEEEALAKPTLLVCPTSVLGNWEREVHKFSPTLQALVHHGDKRAKGNNFAKAIKGKDLVITSYALVYRDAKSLENISWQGVILDEAQNIKNPEAKQSQAVRKLPTEFKIALTGTPVENRLSELWSILDFLNPGYLGNRQFFQRRFAIPIEKYGDTDSLRTLRSLVQPFILRRLKTDRTIIQDLPEKQEMNVFCGLSAEQANLYQKMVDDSLNEIEESEGIQRHGLILTLLLKLKQICNHPAQFLKEKSLDTNQRSGKLQRLEEMLEEAISEGDRALIFTQFAELGKLLQPYLQEKLGWETIFLYGSTRKQQREEMIDRFQNDPEGPRIFILSLKAGGTGLNLTRANHVFHFDRWWNPAVENQATDRVFRIGQKRNVQVHKFICNGTLEEKINDIIESKKQLAEQTVDAGESWLTKMDTNQLRNLLMLDRSAIIDEE